MKLGSTPSARHVGRCWRGLYPKVKVRERLFETRSEAAALVSAGASSQLEHYCVVQVSVL
jgi:hypothetical protein